MSQCLCLKVSVGRLPPLIAWKARPRNPSGEGSIQRNLTDFCCYLDIHVLYNIVGNIDCIGDDVSSGAKGLRVCYIECANRRAIRGGAFDTVVSGVGRRTWR